MKIFLLSSYFLSSKPTFAVIHLKLDYCLVYSGHVYMNVYLPLELHNIVHFLFFCRVGEII